MNPPIPFDQIARLPLPGDNVAIATRRLDAGSRIDRRGEVFAFSHTVLEGHRFAVARIPAGGPLLSWELPFGLALTEIGPGDYVANQGMLDALNGRTFGEGRRPSLPAAPNFADHVEPFTLDEADFTPADPLPPHDHEATFLGYARPGGRGVGTRNMIVLLGTSAQTGGFVRQLAAALAPLAQAHGVDGIVPVAHTEGAHPDPNNREMVLRTLAGFMVHPNVAAVLAVDYGSEAITNRDLRAFAQEQGYPLAHVPHAFLTINQGFQAAQEQAEEMVRAWLPQVSATPRTPQSLAHLKIALQCGGSDAFSGVSGNPVASWVAREVIRYGGAANLAETDELMGAEPYVLQKVTSVDAARRFLYVLRRFEERAAWHGASAAGNPSGGNKYRGLYNIALKSIGAARKRHPDVPLDHVIDYSQPMDAPGFYFMDSPGNDLESIAGQVASGCNLIFFVTGNGSITNFPFVPTIKIVTTSQRYRLLAAEMDVNAGRYLDGESMDAVGQDTLDLTVAVVSGQQSVGERAGHAQVQLWRDWRQSGPSAAPAQSIPAAAPYALRTGEQPPAESLRPRPGDVGLILPTSLCAGQIAQMAARQLNREGTGGRLRRFVALAHTEGCGASQAAEELYIRALLGYLRHPLAAQVLLMEHGCEKTHNDYLRQEMLALGLDLARYGWRSIQMDGGIEATLAQTGAWFRAAGEGATLSAPRPFATIGLISSGPLGGEQAASLTRLARRMAQAGAGLVIPENDRLLSSPAFRDLVPGAGLAPTLAYGQSRLDAPPGESGPGLHVMESPTAQWSELLTGLAATGADLILAHAGEHPQSGHPLVPLLQISGDPAVIQRFGPDLDGALGDEGHGEDGVVDLLIQTLAGAYQPKAWISGNIDLQFSRGLFGITL